MTRVLVKVGGAATSYAAAHVRELAAGRREVCVVHGAGPQISAEMERRGLDVRFVGGRRVTTPAALDVVRESLADVNAALCASIGPRALGLMGDEIGLRAALCASIGPRALGLMGDQIGLRAAQVPELGLVGDPDPVAPTAVLDALDAGRIPVVAPLAAGPLNVNADEMAAALAVGLEASRILFLSDVPGLLLDGAVAASVGADEADRLLDAGELEGGIVPKLHAAVRAARLGVPAHIGETAVLA